MADKTRIIDVYAKGGAFNYMFKKFTAQKEDYNSSDLSLLRQLFSNEKARLLNTIKMKQPKSIYSLAKFLDRDFKSVREDILLLKKFGFIELISGKSGNRQTHKPVLTANSISIIVRI